MQKKDDTLGSMGELEFINSIKKLIPLKKTDILLSAGDDCCAVNSFGESVILSTIDTFVDKVHFSSDYSTWEQIGQRAMAASVSDIAAMSAVPVYSLTSLSMPSDLNFNDAVSLFDGLRKTAEKYGCPVIGGETTSTPGMLTITIAVTGKSGKNKYLKRSGAKPGDSVYITGTIGDSMAGLKALTDGIKDFENIKKKFLLPEALVELSLEMNSHYIINSMIDISDGLSTDINHICDESGCGAVIDSNRLPFSDEYITFAEKTGIEIVDFAVSSGEEFELLFTSSDRNIPDSLSLNGYRITRIGIITDKKDGVLLLKDNNVYEKLTNKGYEHFKK